jgi:hypothetical protein
MPGGLGHALGGAAGGRAEQQLHALGRQDAQDRVDDRGLADAGAAGDDHDLGRERQRMASAWLAARVRPVFCSIHGSALSASISGQGRGPSGGA